MSLNTFVIFMFALLLLPISCREEDEEDTNNSILVGNWKMSGNYYNGVDCWNLPIGTCEYGTDGSCTYSIPECVRDNLYTYKSDNTFIGDEGPSKCNSDDSQTIIGAFSIADDKLFLYINGEKITYTILTLNETTLKISQDGFDGYEIYTKQ